MSTAYIHFNLDVTAGWLRLCATGLRSSTATRDAVLIAVRQDPDLTVQQRETLKELYVAFRDVTRGRRCIEDSPRVREGNQRESFRDQG